MNHLNDIEAIRKEFPILARSEGGKGVAYLDNAATTQKPKSVLAAMEAFLKEHNSNVHRGLYKLAEEADEAYDNARHKIAKFLNAAGDDEVVFTRGTTESMNLLAATLGRSVLNEGDEIILTEAEHHSVIVPWVRVANERGAKVRVEKISNGGAIESLKELGSKTKIVAFSHVSNVLGSINDAKKLSKEAKKVGAIVVIDGAQAVSHHEVNVREIGCDFYGFSGHKMFGPTGIGVLYGRKEIFSKLPPYQGGGGMIENVSFEEITYADLPQRFEAGTPPIAEAIGLGAAVDFIESLGRDNLHKRISYLGEYVSEALSKFLEVKKYGDPKSPSGIASFSLGDAHPHDIATVLAEEGVAIRAGHHCCMPLMNALGVPALARASAAFYNTEEEVERLANGLLKVRRIFK